MTQEYLDNLGITPEEWAEFGPIEKLYLDVSQRLNDEIADLRWIDLEAGQLEIPEDSYPVQFPCALIDFPQAEFQDETKKNQQGLIMVQVRLGIDLYEDLHMADGANAPDRGTAVKRLNLATKIYMALHGWETDYSTPLMRTGIQSERRDDGIKVFTILFACAAKDDTAAERYDTIEGLEMKFEKL